MGSGKTTLADILMCTAIKDDGISATKASFATRLKSIARYMGWNGEKDEKGRKLLQGLGNIGREYCEDVWVGITAAYIEDQEAELAVIDDWRFRNEYDYLARNKYFLPIKVRITRPSLRCLYGKVDLDNDISETSLPTGECYYDTVVKNEGTIEELISKADKLYSDIMNRSEIRWE
jgi:hypothetical protein